MSDALCLSSTARATVTEKSKNMLDNQILKLFSKDNNYVYM